GDPQRAAARLRHRDLAGQPAVGAGRLRARHGRGRAARHRPGGRRGDAAADHGQGRRHRLHDLLRRHLLRRDVRRLHHVHPAEHAGRDGHHGDGHGGQQDGQERPCRRGAGDGGDRLVRRGNDRDGDRHAVRADAGRVRGEAGPARVLHAHGAGLHHRQRGDGQERVAWHDGAVAGPGHRLHRPGPDLGPAALHAGCARTAGRHRDRPRGGGPVRGGRGAVRGDVRGPGQGEPEHAEPRLHDRPRLAAVDPGLAARYRHRRAVRLHPGRWHRDPDFPQLRHGKEAGQGREPRRIWRQGGDRGRRRAGSGQQCHGHRGADPAVDAGHPDVQHHRHPARRLPELRHPAGPAAVHHLRRAGLGADRLPVHRQRDAAGAEPADGQALGAVAEDPQTPAVCRHPDLRHRGRLRHAAERIRPGAAVWHRAARGGDAALRLPDGARGRRHDPGPARRGPAAQRGVDRGGQLHGVPAAADVPGPARGRDRRAGAAAVPARETGAPSRSRL
ncbi:MAG: Tripartite tricarboxylate transporter TctA family, partial [uncultured Ramlibacter sp.]